MYLHQYIIKYFTIRYIVTISAHIHTMNEEYLNFICNSNIFWGYSMKPTFVVVSVMRSGGHSRRQARPRTGWTTPAGTEPSAPTWWLHRSTTRHPPVLLPGYGHHTINSEWTKIVQDSQEIESLSLKGGSRIFRKGAQNKGMKFMYTLKVYKLYPRAEYVNIPVLYCRKSLYFN